MVRFHPGKREDRDSKGRQVSLCEGLGCRMKEIVRRCYIEGGAKFSFTNLFWLVCSGEDLNRHLKCWEEAVGKRNTCVLSFLIL